MERFDLFVILIIAFIWSIIYFMFKKIDEDYKIEKIEKIESKRDEEIYLRDSIIKLQNQLIDYQKIIINEKD